MFAILKINLSLKKVQDKRINLTLEINLILVFIMFFVYTAALQHIFLLHCKHGVIKIDDAFTEVLF